MRNVIVALALIGGLIAAPAAAQETSWTSPERGFSLTLPEMWNIVEHDDAEVVLFLRSLGRGPSGPSAIVCAVERISIPPEGDERMLPREHLNVLTTPVMQRFVEGSEDAPLPPWSVETIDGVAVGGYEVADVNDRVHERRFARLFLVPNGRTLERYVIMCAVQTVPQGQEGDYASMRAFLSSLHFAAETTP